MSDKGILDSSQETQFADLVDKLIKVGPILEIVDGYFFKIIITVLDDKYADQLSVEIKEMLSDLIDAVFEEDIEEVQAICTEIINRLVNVPALDEETEGLLFKSIVQLLVAAVMKWLEGMKQTKVKLFLIR